MRVNVTDPAGKAITNAVVTVTPGNGQSCPLDEDAYTCTVPDAGGAVEFRVRAPGFKEARFRYAPGELSCCEYVFVLQVFGPGETVVTITRSDAAIETTPESVTVIDRRSISEAAVPTLDDLLRQLTGFSIFRRSSSRNANPTTQGVSLRGVGASGASRSAVMFDGVPINDSFGGWVQWSRISPIGVQEVEVLRGGASSLYGGSGLSGAIDLRPRRPSEDLAFSAEVFGGSQRTASASAFVGKTWDSWSADIAGGHFQTRGFIPVDESERGTVDSYAGVRSLNLSTRIEREFGDPVSIFFRPTYFGESRTNGTPEQINRTHSRHFVLGGTVGRDIVRFEWRTFGGTQGYEQTFSSVAADRTTESLTRVQRSPSQSFGAVGTINARAGRHALVAGVEGREVRGSSDEIGFAVGLPTTLLGTGGRERTFALFAKDLVSVGGRVVLSGGVRYDRWKNYRCISVTTPISNSVSASTNIPDRSEDAWSPSVAIQIQATDRFSLRAAASRSFRSPTLNELYRGFRVGNVVTNANSGLQAERAMNAEAGAAYRFEKGAVRVSAFITTVEGAIVNVTIASAPTLITRQRQNAGETRTAGVETEAEINLGRVDLRFGYLFADSRVSAFPSNPLVVDRLIPQVPRHQVTFQTRSSYREWGFSLQARAAGAQFDDDLNQFRLEPYFQLDAFISRRIGEKASLFAALENVFNNRYSVGLTPVRTISSPIAGRLGFRWN